MTIKGDSMAVANRLVFGHVMNTQYPLLLSGLVDMKRSFLGFIS